MSLNNSILRNLDLRNLDRDDNPVWARYAWRAIQVLFFLVALYFSVPQRFGGKTEYSIVNGKSMEPTFHTGDLIIARPADRYNVGDVVVYRIPDEKYPSAFRIVHRLSVQLPNGNFLAQGDNNEGSDAWEITKANIVGKQALMIPKGGVVMSRLLSPLFIGTYIGLIVFWAVWSDDDDEESDEEEDQRDGDEPDTIEPTSVSVLTHSPDPDAVVVGDSVYFSSRDHGSTYCGVSDAGSTYCAVDATRHGSFVA
jgi:signal peptidase I